MMTLAEFEARYANTYVDVDGAAGNQCWDLAQLYYTLCVNPAGTLWTVPGAQHPGYAVGTWEGFAVNGLAADFVPISPAQPTQAGDIVICAWGSATYPVSHVFVTLADAADHIYSLSQNSTPAQPWLPGYSPKSSGPTVRQYLPKDRIAVYLRPKANVSGQSNTITPIPSEEDDMPSLQEFFDHPIERADGKGTITLAQMLRYYSADIAGINTNVKSVDDKVSDIKTASGNVSLRQFVADGTRASQAAAANTGPIKRGGKDISLRQEVADIKTSVIKTDPLIEDIAEAVVITPAVVTAPDVDAPEVSQ